MTKRELAELPEQDGFRLRGVEMTRLETFTDAAFAFAMSMLVISLSEFPKTLQDLFIALEDVPAFAASFAQIMILWSAHRTWSRRYGLEDRKATLLSLSFIFVMLVYVYPLKLVFSTLFAWITGGRLASSFAIERMSDLPTLFVIYGVGFGCMATLLALLYRHAGQQAAALQLDERELLHTQSHARAWGVQACTGLLSAACALFLPSHLGVWSGFIYMTLPLTMHWLVRRFKRQIEALEAAALEAS